MIEEENGNIIWTEEEVIDEVTTAVKKRHGIDYADYVSMLKRNDDSIDRCQDSDIIALLFLIGEGTEAVAT